MFHEAEIWNYKYSAIIYTSLRTLQYDDMIFQITNDYIFQW